MNKEKEILSNKPNGMSPRGVTASRSGENVTRVDTESMTQSPCQWVLQYHHHPLTERRS